MAMMMVRSNQESLDNEQAETANNHNRANQSKEATPSLVRVPPPGRTDTNGLYERSTLGWHFLFLLMRRATGGWSFSISLSLGLGSGPDGQCCPGSGGIKVLAGRLDGCSTHSRFMMEDVLEGVAPGTIQIVHMCWNPGNDIDGDDVDRKKVTQAVMS
jgi:hypothetical protein